MERCTNNPEFIKELREFLYRANQHGYGSAEKPTDLTDGGHMLSYKDKERDWEYIDIWYGGEPYSGITKILYQGKVVWTMVYYGEVRPEINKYCIYNTLRLALMNCKAEYPWRGPKEFVDENGLIYRNQWEGDICHFEGKESISIQDSTDPNLYSASYLGGFVNLR